MDQAWMTAMWKHGLPPGVTSGNATLAATTQLFSMTALRIASTQAAGECGSGVHRLYGATKNDASKYLRSTFFLI
jgi:hypothetical protein